MKHAMSLSDEDIVERLVAVKEHGGIRPAARALGVDPKTLRNTIKRAAERGLDGNVPNVIPEGFIVTENSKEFDEAGNLKKQWVKSQIDRGPVFEKLDGHFVKGESALVDGDNRIIAKWVKTDTEAKRAADVAEIIRKAFEGFTPLAPTIIRPDRSLADWLTVYVFCDWHIGLFAWGKETGGPDWDLSIARRVMLETIVDLIEQTPPSRHALILGLGDLMHADNARNQTERSGNILDVDTRYAKVLPTTVDLLAEASELIAAKHTYVEVALKPGNHDRHSTEGLKQGLRMYYRNSERVTVDVSPNPFYWKRFGVNLIGGTHGDNAKPQDMPLIMANVRKADWSETSTRHCHLGHIHHDTLKEIGGVHVYSHRAPVAQDAFHAANGYLSGRSMRAFNYDFHRGSKGATEVEIP